MKKVLVIGCGYAEIPIIKTLIKKGYYVITVGNNKNGLGHKIANGNAFIDFSDYLKVDDYFCKEKIDYVIPGCNDFAMLTAAYIAEKNNIGNFDSFELTKQLHHKNSFRNTCLEYSLNSPKACSFNKIEIALEYLSKNISNKTSFIVKPIDLTGGKGISKINKGEDYEEILSNAFNKSRAKSIVIEEFIDGINHGFSCFILNAKIKWYFWDDEYYYLDNYSVSGTSYPGSSEPKTILKLIEDLERLSSKLKLKDGLLHVQYIEKNAIPYIIEVMRRPPGDLYLYFVENSKLPKYTDLIVDFYLGIALNTSNFKELKFQKQIFARHCIKGFKKGRIKHVKYSEEIKPFIIKSYKLWKKNMYLEDFLTQKLAIIIFKINNESFAKEFNSNLYKFIEVEYFPE